jgi:hypothetical protein
MAITILQYCILFLLFLCYSLTPTRAGSRIKPQSQSRSPTIATAGHKPPPLDVVGKFRYLTNYNLSYKQITSSKYHRDHKLHRKRNPQQGQTQPPAPAPKHQTGKEASNISMAGERHCLTRTCPSNRHNQSRLLDPTIDNSTCPLPMHCPTVDTSAKHP